MVIDVNETSEATSLKANFIVHMVLTNFVEDVDRSMATSYDMGIISGCMFAS